MCEMCSKNYNSIMERMNGGIQSIQQQMPDYQTSGNPYSSFNGGYN
jgi:hypothetical protein